jgi:hypothetical protein
MVVYLTLLVRSTHSVVEEGTVSRFSSSSPLLQTNSFKYLLIYRRQIKGGFDMVGYIYRITNKLTQQHYIGQTIDINRRRRTHFSHLINNNHDNPKL